jgi:hypothetical protein
MKIKPFVVTALLLPFLIPSLALASASFNFSFSFGTGSACTSNICSIGETILYIINSILVPLLFAIAFIVFLYGIAKAYIFSYGDEERVKEGHKLVLWGIVAFVIMISVWGLVNVVANTFGLYGVSAPPLPTSYPSY